MLVFSRAVVLTSVVLISEAGGCSRTQQRDCRELGDHLSQVLWGSAVTDQRTRDQFMAKCETWSVERVRCLRGLADPGDWPDCDYGQRHHEARAALRAFLGQRPCARALQPFETLRATSDAGTAFDATMYSADLRSSYAVRCEGHTCDCSPGPFEGRCRAFLHECFEPRDGG